MARGDVTQREYPREILLRDGSIISVRPARPDDAEGIARLIHEISSDGKRARFGEPLTEQRLRREAEAIARGDHRVTLLATSGDPEHIIAEGGFVPTDDDRAQVSVTVADAHRGRGIGTQLLGTLAHIAHSQGIHQFDAVISSEQQEVLNVMTESGFPLEIDVQPGLLNLHFPTEFTADAVRKFETRNRIAAAQAVRRMLEPRSVALIGASRERDSIPGTLFHKLMSAGFEGPVYPVNPKAQVVQSVLAFPSIEDVPGEVDLAVIAVPAPIVPGVIDECARKGVPSLVIISAGFAEAGEEGRALQDEVLQRIRAHGMRVIGPNCMGILNTDPKIGLDATFAPESPPAGNIAFASQSGALGMAIIDFAEELGLGISSFVSLGNKADISGNDLLCYWFEDDRTDVILLYLESFGNPRKFSRLAREIGHEKPIVAVKSGRSSAGVRAASSHTGALLASSDTTVDALFRQSGVIRTDTLAEMFDVATLLGRQPLPGGTRVGIVTNAGGPGILCADALEAEDVSVPEIRGETQARLREFLPPHAGFSNPVDLIASATASHYRRSVEALLDDDGIDALIVINIPIADPTEDVLHAVEEAVDSSTIRKPVLFVAMTSSATTEQLRVTRGSLPVYTYPEAAAKALSRSIDYAQWRARPQEPEPRFDDIRPTEAAVIVAQALDRGDEWLDPVTCWQLLDCYGLPSVSQRVVTSVEEIPGAAEQLGSRLALKAFGPDILHKTELGAVETGLAGPSETYEAAREMEAQLSAQGISVSSWVLQSMAEDGVEVLLGAVHDPQFGPVVACGAGGILVELMNDISFRLTPLTATDASEMVHDLQSSRLLTGFRGEPVRDVDALEEALVRLGKMADDLPQIAELDCNPVFVHTQGATIVDARIRVAPI